MLNIVDQAPAESPALEQAFGAAPELERPEEKAPVTTQPETSEYEIVLGRAQIASWLFVVVIVVTVCSSLAYLAGKSTGAKKMAAPLAEAKPAAPSPAPQAAPSPMPTASVVVPPKSDLQTALKTAKSTQPLFGEPESGKVYIQMGAVEKGMATILAEGLRSHGFDAFVAPGPTDKIFRVLIGPLPDPESFRQAKAAVDAIELSTFARKYEK